ncbi:uncharacterized protein LOC116032032 [Ipomoea triloba]|uniref:uncharacterized protein LOC116032032 n=1 Tax=Ipomoea triloba TaxID=35885 RepID=UPI00125D39F0|nr:uncharacterized protein LOC116032032 [Ipomoea triloba]
MDHQGSGNRVEANPELGSTAQSVGETRIAIEVDEKDENSVRRGDDEEEGFCCGEDLERVCRICHLNAKDMKNSKDLIIELGCNCKGELGFAHLHCAEAWFKLKGNRLCEICGETVKNVRGVGDARFMEEWNDGGASAAESGKSCWNGQPFCNFLMACLVITLLLPWFLRVDIF